MSYKYNIGATTVTLFSDMAEVEDANKKAGEWFFSPGAMKGFGARRTRKVYTYGMFQYFMASYRMNPDQDRFYQIEAVYPTGHIYHRADMQFKYLPSAEQFLNRHMQLAMRGNKKSAELFFPQYSKEYLDSLPTVKELHFDDIKIQFTVSLVSSSFVGDVQVHYLMSRLTREDGAWQGDHEVSVIVSHNGEDTTVLTYIP